MKDTIRIILGNDNVNNELLDYCITAVNEYISSFCNITTEEVEEKIKSSVVTNLVVLFYKNGGLTPEIPVEITDLLNKNIVNRIKFI